MSERRPISARGILLEYREVPRWQKLLDRLLADKEIMGGVPLKFQDLSEEIEQSNHPSKALKTFLGEIPKPH